MVRDTRDASRVNRYGHGEQVARFTRSLLSAARKSNIQQARGLDEFVNVLDDGIPVVIADMGAGAGEVAHRWFDSMSGQAKENGVAFTAMGLVTPDPASV